MRERAKQLRRSSTASEQRLWSWLRNRTFDGFKFRRQVPIGRYVVDFYCAALKLAIEVDGRQHEAVWMADYDGKRTDDLRALGIEIVRLTNEQLARDSMMVEEILASAIAERVAEGRV